MTADLARVLDQLDQAHAAANTPGGNLPASLSFAREMARHEIVNALPALVAAVRAVAELAEEDPHVCNCYPEGSSPSMYEGPREWCPVHGRPLRDRIRAALAPLPQNEDAR